MSRTVNFLLLGSAWLGLAVRGAALLHQPANSQTAVAKQKAAAAAVVQKVQEAYAKLKTFQARFTLDTATQFQQQTAHVVMNGQLAFNHPNQFAVHMQLSGPNGFLLEDMTTICDGKQMWIVMGKKYLQKPIGEVNSGLLTMGLPNSLTAQPHQINSPLQFIASDIAAGQVPKDIRLIAYKPLNGKPAYVLQYTELLPVPPSSPAGTKMIVQIWVDAATHLIRRIVTHGSLQGTTMQMAEDIRPTVVNTPLPPSLFTYQPPKDAQKVGTMAELFNLPAQGSTPQAATNDSSQKRAAKLIGKPAPDFTLKTIDGKTVSLHDLRGKIILLDFSTSW